MVPPISSVLEKEFRLQLEECSLTDEEVKIIAELDILLRKSYRDLEEGIEEIGEERLNGILRKTPRPRQRSPSCRGPGDPSA